MFQRSVLLRDMFMKEKGLSVMILTTSVISSFSSSIGLTLLIPVLFISSTFSLTNGVPGLGTGQANLITKLTHYLPVSSSFGLVVFILAFIMLKNILSIYRTDCCGRLVKKHQLFLREELLAHFLKKDLLFFQKTGSGPLLNQLTLSIEKASRIANDTIEIFGMSFQAITYAVALYFISKVFLLVSLLTMIPMAVIVKSLSLGARMQGRELNKESGKLTQDLASLMQSIRIVKLGARENDHRAVIRKKSVDIQQRHRVIHLMGGITYPMAEITATILLFVLIGIVVKKWVDISATEFFSFLLILSRMLPIFNTVMTKKVEVASNMGALVEIEDQLADSSLVPVNTGTRNWTKLSKGITFENVSFAYPGVDATVLNNLSFDINVGDHVAIVGPSGSGKSTLIDLLLRFYSVTSGKIKIDGVSLDEIKLADLRSKIALVPQESTLLFSTLRENLSYFQPTASEIELWRVLELADLADFVSNLEEGLETQLGERGVNLSGGQRQRLCIARALLMKPEILIFDEATSSLDSLSEAKIVESIKRASQGRTTITIAHRLGTVFHCNKVFMIEHGWMTESGNLTDLLNRSSRFKKYAEAQNLLKVG